MNDEHLKRARGEYEEVSDFEVEAEDKINYIIKDFVNNHTKDNTNSFTNGRMLSKSHIIVKEKHNTITKDEPINAILLKSFLKMMMKSCQRVILIIILTIISIIKLNLNVKKS